MTVDVVVVELEVEVRLVVVNVAVVVVPQNFQAARSLPRSPQDNMFLQSCSARCC